MEKTQTRTAASVEHWLTELAGLGGEQSPADFARSQAVLDCAHLPLASEDDVLSDEDAVQLRRLKEAIRVAERQLDVRLHAWMDAMAAQAVRK